MFGGSSNSSGSKIESDSKAEAKSPSPSSSPDPNNPGSAKPVLSQLNSVDERGGYASPPSHADAVAAVAASSNEKKRRGSGVGSRASNFLASAKNTLNFSQGSRGNADLSSQTPLQKLGKQDPALAVPQGQHNNSAGESVPGPRSTFRVGVWEDRNKRCRRTMEDTHAFLYNFLATPLASGDLPPKLKQDKAGAEPLEKEVVESDNGYFAIFDGHAGTFAADWCGKKLHLLLEDTIRKNPAAPIPELLDMTFTAVDAQLEKLPLKNSGCTAAIALLRWENRTPASALERSAHVALTKPASQPTEINAVEKDKNATTSPGRGSSVSSSTDAVQTKRRTSTMRQRILYTANVGDARIILCRGGRALRLSYDHKGSDELEGKRVTNAGGMILNNRVNGVLAVTRALGDAYMKELVTGHPYTTETVIQPDVDEFLIIACDGLWDVCSDQEAVDLVRKTQDPIAASKKLVEHALDRFSTDNLSCMIVRFENAAATAAAGQGQGKTESESAAGTESATSTKVSEAEKIVSDTRQKIAEGMASPLGISASNSGRGYDTLPADGGQLVVTTLDEAVEEELETSGKDDVVEVTATQGQDEDVSEATLTTSSEKGEKGCQE